MRTVLNVLSGFTLAASSWLGIMFVVLHHAGYERGVAMAALFVAQSLVTLAVANRVLASRPWKMLTAVGACAVIFMGASGVVAQFTGPHFEGYIVIIGSALVAQGLLTLARLVPALPSPSSKVHQFGN